VSEGAAPDPAVPQELYDEHYYLNLADGHEAFAAGETAGRYAWALEQLAVPDGGTLLDVGCGRGELVFWALEHGAGRAIGVEYAEAAIEVARGAAAERGYGERAELLAADARAIPLPDATADGIAMLDVIEHLTFAEQAAALQESLRLLKPGGRFILHTFPNRSIYETYSKLRRVWPGGRNWPVDPRKPLEKQMHVGELTAKECEQQLAQAGFTEVEVSFTPWIYTDHVPSRRAKAVFRRIAEFGPTEHLAKASLVATASAPA